MQPQYFVVFLVFFLSKRAISVSDSPCEATCIQHHDLTGNKWGPYKVITDETRKSFPNDISSLVLTADLGHECTVVFYENADKTGWKSVNNVDNRKGGPKTTKFTLAELESTGFKNDDAAYIEMTWTPNNATSPCSVTCFEHHDLTGIKWGPYKVITSTIRDTFPTHVSSMSLTADLGYQCTVTFNGKKDQTGWSSVNILNNKVPAKKTVQFTLADLQKTGFVNDAASYVELYWDTHETTQPSRDTSAPTINPTQKTNSPSQATPSPTRSSTPTKNTAFPTEMTSFPTSLTSFPTASSNKPSSVTLFPTKLKTTSTHVSTDTIKVTTTATTTSAATISSGVTTSSNTTFPSSQPAAIKKKMGKGVFVVIVAAALLVLTATVLAVYLYKKKALSGVSQAQGENLLGDDVMDETEMATSVDHTL